MARSFLLLVIFASVIAGCSHVSRKGIMSRELPLTVNDLAEIRAGEKNHEEVLQQYKLYDSPALNAYLNRVAANIAAASTRPSLPYRVVILDDNEVNLFGGPGGYIYVTRGLLRFVSSESEAAGLMAHEIGHISHYDYSGIPHLTKMQYLYKGMLLGTEIAKNSIGTYGTAAYAGVKGLGKVAPYVGGRFAADQEIVADDMAVKFLMKAGYDPRGLQAVIERLAKVQIEDVGRFVIYMDVHPPFQDRRAALAERLKTVDFHSGSIDFRKDTLDEMRQVLVNTPDSILFQPKFKFDIHSADPLDEFRHGDSLPRSSPYRKRLWD